MGSNDQSHQILKGKRTKRQRFLSPFGFAATDSSSSGSGDGQVGGGGGRGVFVDDYNSTSSPTTSGEIYESTEEEEDMANCLIMLAQGDAPRQIQDHKVEKLNSRKFAEIDTSTNKAGFYVYECKTCNRSFPSFQALGGHRASHKKPKATATESEKKSSSVSLLALKDANSEDRRQQFSKSSPPHPLSVQAVGNINTKANKIHECSICGSEFTSGQALGGHMRRHRAAASAATGNQVAAAISIDNTSNNNIDQSNSDGVKPAARSILPLDLNLPAPEDDLHLRDSNKFQFGSTQQALVFSAPALVHCHY